MSMYYAKYELPKVSRTPDLAHTNCYMVKKISIYRTSIGISGLSHFTKRYERVSVRNSRNLQVLLSSLIALFSELRRS